MSPSVHIAPLRRILAALIAVGLTGVPALALEQLAEARGSLHRCHCPPGGHHCECPVCRSELRRARRARLADLPACHRARELAAIAREEAREDRSAPGPSPCLRSSCDDEGGRLPAPTSREAFVLPAHPASLARALVTRVPGPSVRLRTRPREPEVPPPRAA